MVEGTSVIQPQGTLAEERRSALVSQTRAPSLQPSRQKHFTVCCYPAPRPLGWLLTLTTWGLLHSHPRPCSHERTHISLSGAESGPPTLLSPPWPVCLNQSLRKLSSGLMRSLVKMRLVSLSRSSLYNSSFTEVPLYSAGICSPPVPGLWEVLW